MQTDQTDNNNTNYVITSVRMHLNTFSMASFSISSSFPFTCLKIFCLIGQDKRLKHINGKLGRPVSMSTWKRRPINSKTASCWRRPRRSKSNRTSAERATTKTTNFARFAGGLKSIIKQCCLPFPSLYF